MFHSFYRKLAFYLSPLDVVSSFLLDRVLIISKLLNRFCNGYKKRQEKSVGLKIQEKSGGLKNRRNQWSSKYKRNQEG